MKSTILFLLSSMLLITSGLTAQKANHKSPDSEKFVTETFRVYGNCGMCKKTIEGSLKDVVGVIKGDWDKSTGLLNVSYDPESITIENIKQRIANVGYDSDTHRAKDEIYYSLPGCCQYERPKK